MNNTWTRTRALYIGEDGAGHQLAMAVLAAPGVEAAEWRAPLLKVRYDLRVTDLQSLMDALGTRQAHLMERGWRSWWLRFLVYRDAIARQNIEDDWGWDARVRSIHMSRHAHRRSGRREERPQHWRQYLERSEPRP